MTEWTKRLIFLMRVSDLSAAERQTLRRAFSNNDSGERETDEDKMFDAPAIFSTTGELPAQVLAINTLAKPAMLTALRGRMEVLPQAIYYVIDNRTATRGQLLATNDGGVTVTGQPWDWLDVLARLFTLRGLLPIIGVLAAQIVTEAGEGLATEANEPIVEE